MRCTTPKPSETKAPGEPSGAADEFGERLGQREALAVVLAGLAGIEADVLQQQDVAVGEALRARQCIRADDITGQLDVPAELLGQRLGHRGERELRRRTVFGPTEVGGDDDLGAGVGQRLQRGHRRDDAARVGDVAVVVERDVQVGAHQYAPARNPFCQ